MWAQTLSWGVTKSRLTLGKSHTSLPRGSPAPPTWHRGNQAPDPTITGAPHGIPQPGHWGAGKHLPEEPSHATAHFDGADEGVIAFLVKKTNQQRFITSRSNQSIYHHLAFHLSNSHPRGISVFASYFPRVQVTGFCIHFSQKQLQSCPVSHCYIVRSLATAMEKKQFLLPFEQAKKGLYVFNKVICFYTFFNSFFYKNNKNTLSNNLLM